MAIGGKRNGSATVDDRRFVALNRRFPLRPIRSDEVLARAHAIIEDLISRDDRDPAEDDYLDVLAGLASKYEDEAHPMPDVSAEDMLRHLMDVRDLSQADVARGARIVEPTISAILAGKRRLNLRHIMAIARYLGVDPAVFLSAARG